MKKKPKIFVIGFNKCGTTSLHNLFCASGIKSAHYNATITKDGQETTKNLAKTIITNHGAFTDPLSGIEGYDAFSDMSFCDATAYLEACRLFPYIWAHYPDAYYILNSRDIEDWIRSRIMHTSKRRGKLLDRATKAFGCDEHQLRDLWRKQFVNHHQECRRFFGERECKFIEFKIDSDPIENIARFLSPHYKVNTKYWSRLNPSK